jgi:hypothetical protein
MLSDKGESYLLVVHIMFNFKIFGYNIWRRFKDMILCIDLFLSYIINV